MSPDGDSDDTEGVPEPNGTDVVTEPDGDARGMSDTDAVIQPDGDE